MLPHKFMAIYLSINFDNEAIQITTLYVYLFSASLVKFQTSLSQMPCICFTKELKDIQS